MTRTPPTAGHGSRDIVLTRTFDAPRERVFDAWTDPEQVGKWWGPNGFTTTTHEMDVKPGGVWRNTMHGPDGTDYPNHITYQEVVAPERLAYAHGSNAQHEDGFHVTITFDQEGKGTRVTMRMRFPTAADRDRTVEFGAVEGGNQTLARLAEHLGAS